MFDFSWKKQSSQKVAQIIGQHKQTWPHLIREEMLASKAGPVESIFTFFYPLLSNPRPL